MVVARRMLVNITNMISMCASRKIFCLSEVKSVAGPVVVLFGGTPARLIPFFANSHSRAYRAA